MRLDQLGSAARLATKMSSLKERREAWAAVDLTNATVARRINDNNTHDPNRIPSLDDDIDMHQAIVEAIIAEYDLRINTTVGELVQMGVEL
jgi:hypothetical protein